MLDNVSGLTLLPLATAYTTDLDAGYSIDMSITAPTDNDTIVSARIPI